MASLHSIKPILCINKSDLLENFDQEFENIKKVYPANYYDVLFTSATIGTNIDSLEKLLRHKINLFAGPSGVGKSSIINKLNPGFNLKVDQVSQKNLHGKHTTRFVELVYLNKDCLLLDSPGFTNLTLEIASTKLIDLFPDLKEYAVCKFKTCLHHNEPGCNIKEAVSDNKLAFSRYNSYIKFLEILLEQEKNKYKKSYKKTYNKKQVKYK